MAATAASKKLDPPSPEQIGLEATVMAIREEVMSYFKGSCIGRVTTGSPVRLVNLNDYLGESRYAFQRQQREQEKPTLVMLGNAPILTLKMRPDTVIFHEGVLTRSKQFREIYKQLDKFLDKFLRGVKKEVNHAVVIYG